MGPWREIQRLLSKYGLAICCVVGPLLLGYWAPNFVGGRLLPQFKPGASPIVFVFTEPKAGNDDASPRPAGATSQPTASVPPQQGASANPTNTAPIPAPASAAAVKAQIYQSGQIAAALAGPYGYVSASAFLYLASVAALLFASAVVVWRHQWIIFFLSAAIFAIVAYLIAQSQTAYQIGRDLLLDKLLAAAQADPLFKPFVEAQKTVLAAHVAASDLVEYNTLIGVFAVGVVLTAFACLAIRDDRELGKPESPQRSAALQLMHADLIKRMMAMRGLLALGSAILVIAVLASKALLEWPLKLVADSQYKALKPLADAVTAHLGTSGSIALFTAAAPAIMAWSLDKSRYRQHVASPAEQTSEPKDGLEFAPSSMIANVLVVLAPVLASPIADVIKSAVQLASKIGPGT